MKRQSVIYSALLIKIATSIYMKIPLKKWEKTCTNQQDCSLIACPKSTCKSWQIPYQRPCDCCPTCEPPVCRSPEDCSFELCRPLKCPSGESPKKLPCSCCPICLPTKCRTLDECRTVRCPNSTLSCPSGQVPKTMQCNCCPECAHTSCKGTAECAVEAQLCPDLKCKYYQERVYSPCNCCPACVPLHCNQDCSFAACEELKCQPDETVIKHPCSCCPKCVRAFEGCEFARCDVEPCRGGLVRRKLRGCCDECVPEGCKGPQECASVFCTKPKCSRGEKSITPLCECCPICVKI